MTNASPETDTGDTDDTDDSSIDARIPEREGPLPRTHGEEIAAYLAEVGLQPDVVLNGGDLIVAGTFAGTIVVKAGTLTVEGVVVGNVLNEGGTVILMGRVTGTIAGDHTVVEKPSEADEGDDAVNGADPGSIVASPKSDVEPVAPVRRPVIEVEGLGKKFATSLHGTMRHGISDSIAAMMGRKTEKQSTEDEFWALRDINFNLYEGGAIGMMGLNGSGKTTLMRVLAGLYEPDEGSVTVHGSAIGIFGVGSGFHPHLSGRENVYINAALLGLTRDQIDNRLEEILDFAELGNFIDSATGLYSSGMRMRLGFSIMTTLRPQTLLLDEVFAVGDMAFREKCLERLREIRDTTTIFIVAQHPVILDGICDELLWIHKGAVQEYGDFYDVMDIFTRFAGRAQIEGSLGSARSSAPGK